jgi:hypothetical protein
VLEFAVTSEPDILQSLKILSACNIHQLIISVHETPLNLGLISLYSSLESPRLRQIHRFHS